MFRELRDMALERLCDRILDEARREIGRSGKSSHERYLSLYQGIQKGDDDIARGFNDSRRSTALTQIGIIHSMGLFTGEELRRFSTEVHRVIELYGPIPDARPRSAPADPAIASRLQSTRSVGRVAELGSSPTTSVI